MKPKVLIIAFFLILCLGSLLRFTSLNSLPVFADEAIYVRWSQVMKAEPSLRFLPLTDGKQPLFMWLTIPMFKFISDPLVAGRTLAGLVGLSTILGVGFASYLLFRNPRIAIISSLLWSVLPYALFFERLSLADSTLAMFLIWTFNLLVIAIEKTRLDFAMLAGFSLGFAYLTKSPALFYFFLFPSIILVLPKSSVNPVRLLKILGLLLTTFIIALGMYNILRLGPEFHQIALRNADYVHPLSELLKHPLDPLVPHLKDSFMFYLYFATPIGLLFIIWGMFDSHDYHASRRLLLIILFLTPIIAQSFMAKAFTARYLFFTLPFAVMLMAHGLEHLGQRTQKHLLTVLGLFPIVIASVWVDYLLITNPSSAPLPRIERAGYLEEWTAGYGIREISQSIKEASKSGPVLVGSEGFFGTPFSALELYLNQVPGVRITGVGVDINSTPDKLLSATSDNQVFLVVNSSRFSGDPQDLQFESKWHLKLISSYPKAIKPDNTHESLYFFKVLQP